jgi:hypothetical protein
MAPHTENFWRTTLRRNLLWRMELRIKSPEKEAAMDSQKDNDPIRRAKERVERKPDPIKDGDNFRFLGWGGVLGAKIVLRTEK